MNQDTWWWRLIHLEPALLRTLAPVWLASPYDVPQIPDDLAFDVVIIADAAALSLACVHRARDHAAAALARAGRAGDADELRGLDDPEAIRERALAGARGASREVADPLGFAADAVTMSRGSMPDTALLAELAPPTTAAVAANVAFTDGGYAAERAWQLGWLRNRLGIAGPGSPEGRSP